MEFLCSLLVPVLNVELDISEDRLDENAKELEDEISLPLSLVGFFAPYKLSAIPTEGMPPQTSVSAFES